MSSSNARLTARSPRPHPVRAALVSLIRYSRAASISSSVPAREAASAYSKATTSPYVGLSLALFLMLMAAYYFGFITDRL